MNALSIIPLALLLAAASAGAAEPLEVEYDYRRASPDGIGKVYMGREISQVMGHLGAGWLERSSREREERTDLLLKNLKLGRTDVVADIGAGTGYFSLPIARQVPDGSVLAVDIQPEMLAIIAGRARAAGLGNIETILGTETDPLLPAESVDLALMVDAYHEFSHPREVMAGIVRGLKPGGRVVLIEYRGEDPRVPIKTLHKMTEAQARLELEAAGLRWSATCDFLPQQHFMVFERPAADRSAPSRGWDCVADQRAGAPPAGRSDR